MVKPKVDFAALLKLWQQEPLRFYEDQVILEDGRRLGEAIDPWQREDLLGTATHEHSIRLRPRGHSKTGDCGDEILYDLIVGPPGLKSYSMGSDLDQSSLLIDDVTGKAQRNPLFRKLLKVTKNVITNRITRQSHTALAADLPGSWGLRIDRLYCDEMSEWPERGEQLWQSLFSATGKRAGARIRVISSPGHSEDSLLWRVLQMAKSEPATWYVSERGQVASWITKAWLAQQEKALPRHVYDRLHRGLWTTGHGLYFTGEEIRRIFTPWSGQIVLWCLGVDLGLARDRCVVAVVGVTADGLIIIQHLLTFEPRRGQKVDLVEVEAEIREIASRLNALVCIDPWQAALMSARLRNSGVEVVEYPFTQASRMKLYSRLLDVVRQDQLRSHPHELFEKELFGLRVEPRGAAWRVDHGPSGYDDHCIAVGLAIGGLAAIQVIEPNEIPEHERQQIRSIERHLGRPGEPALGWGALAYEDDWRTPVDRRYAADWSAYGDLGPNGYCDGPLEDGR
jgi:hypothetical protein